MGNEKTSRYFEPVTRGPIVALRHGDKALGDVRFTDLNGMREVKHDTEQRARLDVNDSFTAGAANRFDWIRFLPTKIQQR